LSRSNQVCGCDTADFWYVYTAVHQGLFVLVYKSDSFSNKVEARKREAQIKKWSRNKKEKLISGE